MWVRGLAGWMNRGKKKSNSVLEEWRCGRRATQLRASRCGFFCVECFFSVCTDQNAKLSRIRRRLDLWGLRRPALGRGQPDPAAAAAGLGKRMNGEGEATRCCRRRHGRRSRRRPGTPRGRSAVDNRQEPSHAEDNRCQHEWLTSEESIYMAEGSPPRLLVFF